MRGGQLGLALIAASTAAWSAPAQAQAVPGQLPSRPEITPPAPTSAPPARVRVDGRGAIARQNCPFEGSDLRVDLSRISFTRPDGSPVAPEIAQSLQGIAAPGAGASIAAVCDIRDAANAALRRDGWIASVQVPPQEVNEGSLRLDVITARIVETRVRGNPGPYEALLRERIAAIEALQVLNEREAERLLLLAGDIPGLDVQMSLRPAGGEAGAVIGDLTISYSPFAVLGNVQNYNAAFLGRETAYLRGEFYGLTGMGDVTYLGASTTADLQEQIIVQGGHVMTLSGAGTTLGLRVTHAWSRPSIGALDLRSNTLVAGFDVRQPLKRSLRANAALVGGFDYVNQDSSLEANGTRVPLTRDRLRVAYLGIEGDARGIGDDGSTLWSLRGNLTLRKGLDLFGATPRGGALQANGALPSRIDGNAQAFIARAELEADARAAGFAGGIFSVAFRAMAQWTDDPLLNYDEFSLGNLTVGRGYDPGSNSGDRAFGLRSELRADVVREGPVTAQIFGFGDYVRLTNLDPNSTEVDRTLRSFGGGVRATLWNTALLEVTYASPQDPALIIDRAPPPDRVLVSLTFQLGAGQAR